MMIAVTSFPDTLPELVGNFDEARYAQQLRGQHYPGEPLVMGAARLQRMLRRLYGEPLMGTTRAVFLDHARQIAWKVPRVYESADDVMLCCMANQDEKQGIDGIPCAQTRYYTDMHGIPVIAMELLAMDVTREERPEWAMWLDGMQCARTADGEIVAFDWAATGPGLTPYSRPIDYPLRS